MSHRPNTDPDGDPIFRTSYLVDSRREWIRAVVPNARQGFVVEDLDLILRYYQPGSPYGRYLKCEFKWNNAVMSAGQRMTHELEHWILRKGDPERKVYIGFYLVHWPALPMSDDHQPEIDFSRNPLVNGHKITWAELREFLMFKKVIPSLFDNGNGHAR